MRITSTLQLLSIFRMKSSGFGNSRAPLLMSIKQQLSSSTNAAYKRVLTDEINRKKLTLAGDQVALDRMINDFYVPVYLYFKNLLDKRDAGSHSRPLFIGISAPQGVGKTTLTEFMRALFAAEGKSCLSVSIDDFYLTGPKQESLAAAHPTNPLLTFRGNAGSHDVQLMEDTLHALGNINHPQLGGTVTAGTAGNPGTAGRVRVPQYDKSLRGGRGDRADVSEWLEVLAPLDVVLLEGWMLGFTPVDVDVADDGPSRSGLNGKGQSTRKDTGVEMVDAVQEVEATVNTSSGDVWERHPGMVEVNRQLRRYQHLHELFDAWLVLAVEDDDHDVKTGLVKGVEVTGETSTPEVSSATTAITTAAGIGAVYQWRLQAETAMRAAGRPGLSNAQVADFVARFMPAYEAYLPVLYGEGPQRRGKEIPVLKVSGVGEVVM